MVKTRYAVQGDGQVVSIDEVTLEMKSGPFLCIGCGARLSAKIGQRKARHFSHLADDSGCNRETYLHALAKATLFAVISERLQNGGKFTIYFSRPQKCKVCHFPDRGLANCDLGFGQDKFNLLAKYREVFLEKSVGDFRPDILLLDPVTKDMIFF